MAGKSALLIVDVQNDFCPGGSLAVPEGDAVVPVMNRYIRLFHQAGLPVFASRDWHPTETRHFEASGGPWPPHCVRETEGAAFHPDLELPDDTTVVSKGTDPIDHGYTAFEGRTPEDRTLEAALRERGVDRLYVGGLATDYCVRASVIDAAKAGFETVLLEDAVRGIDVEPGDVDRAVREMREAGASAATFDEVAAELE